MAEWKELPDSKGVKRLATRQGLLKMVLVHKIRPVHVTEQAGEIALLRNEIDLPFMQP
jgi:hypothetical protein